MSDFNLINNKTNAPAIFPKNKPLINLIKPQESITLNAGKNDSFVSPVNTAKALTKADNGKFDIDEGLKNFAKGFISPVTAMFSSLQNFVAGLGSVAIGAVLTVATRGAVLPIFIAVGAGTGLFQGGKAVYNIINAKNGDDVEKAFFDVGAATFTVGSSVLGAKSALKGANIETEGLNPVTATIKCLKETPSLVMKSFNYIKDGKALAAFTAAIKGKHSPDNQAELQEKKALEQSLTELNEKIKEAKSLESVIAVKLEEKMALQTQLDGINAEISQAKTLKSGISEKIQEKKALEAKLNGLKNEISQSEKLKADVAVKVKELKDQELRLSENNQKLDAELTKKTGELETLGRLEEKAVSTVENLNKKIADFERQKAVIEQDLAKNIKLNDNQKIQMKVQAKELQQKADAALIKLNEVQEKHSQIIERKAVLESDVKSLEQKKAGLQADAVTLQGSLDSKKLEFANFEKQALGKKNKINAEISQLEQKRNQALSGKNIAETEVKKLDAQLNAKKTDLKNIDEQIAVREKALNDYEGKVNGDAEKARLKAEKESVLVKTQELQSKAFVKEHPAVGKQLEIALDKDGEFLIGREASDVCVSIGSDPIVSGKHLKINRTGGNVEITDLSTNGTKVNGLKIEKGANIPLKISDEVQIGNSIYVFDGSKLKTLTNDAVTYREFFGIGVKNIRFSQGQVGDCYLLAGFDSLRDNINAAPYLANMIRKSANGDITVNFAGAGKEITFAASEVSSVLGEKGIVGSVKGVRLLERAYGRLIKSERQAGKPSEHKTIILMSGGRPNQAMEALVPAKKDLVSWGNDVGDPQFESTYIPMAEKFLSYFSANKEKATLVANTRRNISNASQGHNFILSEIDGVKIAQTHAYSVKDVDMINKTVTVSNPWDSTSRAVIGFNDFFKYFGAIDRVFIH